MVDFQDTPSIALAAEKPAIIRPLKTPAPAVKDDWQQAAILTEVAALPRPPLSPYEKIALLAEECLGPAPGLEGIAVPSIN